MSGKKGFYDGSGPTMREAMLVIFAIIGICLVYAWSERKASTSNQLARGKNIVLLQQTIEQCAPLVPDGGPNDHNRLMVAINLASLFRSYDLVGTTTEGDSLIFRDSTNVWKVYIKPSSIVLARQH